MAATSNAASSSSPSSRSSRFASGVAAAAAFALFTPALAEAAFSAIVGPPRFELHGNPGAVVRDAFDIANDSLENADFAVRSADWELAPDGSVVFRDADLASASCRPWVRLERRDIRLAPKANRKFRFEVQVPADAPAGECRFALLIEGKEPSVAEGGLIKLPMQGRIAVIVYVAVGDAKPKLEFRSMQVSSFNGQPFPSITLANTGNAHGRPEGILEARDADGKSLEFSVSPSPLLPGTTRTLPIWPNDGPDGKPPKFNYPLRLKGTVEWDGGQYKVDTVVRP
jgi:fimbrial chaperone protein